MEYFNFNDGVADWSSILMNSGLNDQIILNFDDQVDWSFIQSSETFSDQYKNHFLSLIHSVNNAIYANFANNYINTFENNHPDAIIDWDVLNQISNQSFLSDYQSNVLWNFISISKQLSLSFIRIFKDFLNWTQLSISQSFSEDFIEEYQNRVDWIQISIWQVLSDDFIRRFSHKLHWNWLVVHQSLSESLIEDFISKVNLTQVLKHQNVSTIFKLKYTKKEL